jgi:nucleotide-binding universal stress UspA family protein
MTLPKEDAMQDAIFRHILIPTDGSNLSEKAVHAGMTLAKTLNASVTAVHVFPSYLINLFVLSDTGPVDTRVQQEVWEAARRNGNKYLDHIETVAKSAGVKFDRVIAEGGNVWEGIVKTAQEKGCDLIVMAAHGRGGVAALLLGSETNKVLTHSKIPVLVYR